MDKIVHEGHRRRMYEKLKNGENLYEHELLEILLYNAYPRKNTNPIAHALLERYPSIDAVLSAEPEELMTVEGVGEQIALYLKCIYACVKSGNSAEGFAVFNNREDFYSFVRLRLRGINYEVLELYFLDKNGKLTRICRFTSKQSDKVTVKPEEVVKLISVSHPFGIVIAHNHTNGKAHPSKMDDDFTKQCQLICSFNNVRLYDHIIYASDDDIYSYFDCGGLDEIEREYSILNIIKNGR